MVRVLYNYYVILQLQHYDPALFDYSQFSMVSFSEVSTLFGCEAMIIASVGVENRVKTWVAMLSISLV
jgi:hypothetical protein